MCCNNSYQTEATSSVFVDPARVVRVCRAGYCETGRLHHHRGMETDQSTFRTEEHQMTTNQPMSCISILVGSENHKNVFKC